MNQYFICTEEEIVAKLKVLIKTGISPDGWIHYYIDKITKEEWHLTTYESEYQGGGIQVFKRLPEPTIDELINIAITSISKNDIIGASLELLEREKYKNEDFREKLLYQLLKIDTLNLIDFEKERIKIIIYESNLYDSTNRKNIVGKHFTEIEVDANYYRTISQKANNIISEIGE